MITDGIFDIPAEKLVRDDDKLMLKEIPVYDAPTLLIEKPW